MARCEKVHLANICRSRAEWTRHRIAAPPVIKIHNTVGRSLYFSSHAGFDSVLREFSIGRRESSVDDPPRLRFYAKLIKKTALYPLCLSLPAETFFSAR